MAFTYSSTLPNLTCSFQPISAVNRRLPPARDKPIDFGKHKGKMLGSLPSSYLKWVSKTLRAGDSIHWATLADQVLQDPVYHDRLEWEFADSILNGNTNNSSSSTTDAVSRLVEVSERFGWDNEDKIGWSRVNFELLGTSKGGRIPRLKPAETVGKGGHGEVRVERRLEESQVRRKERRERVKLKKVGENMGELGIVGKFGGGVVNIGSNGVGNEKMGESLGQEGNINNRFPGRQGLFQKVISSKLYL
ncbi:hypothetical protein M5689_018309 [Euphorbia peplus]|nr:hypothetical protein M5689_018309 [Euphorbia peplus]